jgi:hypothetical protein
MISKGLLASSLLVVIFGSSIGCEPKAPSTSELTAARDSLKMYKDSLRAVQKAWSFNVLSAVVKLGECEPVIGDTCYATIHVAGANDWDNGYRYERPLLTMTTQAPVIVTDRTYFWQLAFVPQRLGEDSLTGTVKFSTPGFRDSTELTFSTHYVVKPR